MRGFFNSSRRLRRPAVVALAAALIGLPLASAPSAARGPDRIADVAESVIEAVVNISTSQTVEARGAAPAPQLPPGSPFQEFFDDFFKERRGAPGGEGRERGPRRVSSLGSGFVIDAVWHRGDQQSRHRGCR